MTEPVGLEALAAVVAGDGVDDADVELARQAVATADRITDRPTWAETLYLSGSILLRGGQEAEARACFERLLAGDVDPATAPYPLAAAAIKLAGLAAEAGDLPAAVAWYGTARSHLSKAPGDADPQGRSLQVVRFTVAASLGSVEIAAEDLVAASNDLLDALLVVANPASRAALEAGAVDGTTVPAPPGEPPELLARVVMVVEVCSQLGLLADAERLLRRIVVSRQRRTGDEPATGEAAVKLATFYRVQGSARDSLDWLVFATRCFGGSTDADPGYVGEIANEAGRQADGLGEFALAAVLYERAADVWSRSLPPDDERVLTARYNLAELARVTGDVDFALTWFDTVAEASRRAHLDRLLVLTLKNRALALQQAGRVDEAAGVVAEALTLATGDASDLRATVLLAEATIDLARGRFVEAEAAAAEVVELVGGLQGSDPARAAAAQLDVAMARSGQGDHVAARELCRTAIEALEQGPDPDAAVAGRAYANLAAEEWITGDHAAALHAFQASAAKADRVLAETTRVHSSFELGDHLREPWPLVSPVVHLVVEAPADSDDARRFAFRLAVSRKRVQVELVAALRELLLQGDRQAGALFRQVSQSLGREDPTAASGTGDPDPAAPTGSPDRALSARVTADAVQAIFDRSSAEAIAEALPSPLVEYVRCDAIETVDGALARDARYVAFVLPPGHPEHLALVDLGDTEPIDRAVSGLRAALPGVGRGMGPASPRRTDVHGGWAAAAAALRRLAWDPIVESLAGATSVLIAPDGALARVPLDVLADDDGRPLLKTLDITLLMTGRDAQRAGTRPNWRSTDPVVVVAPRFATESGPGALPGTEREGAWVGALIGCSTIVGDAATKEIVLAVDDPEILHLATHGYVLPRASSGGDGQLSARLQAQARNAPLRRCVLALAGAARPTPGVDPPRDGFMSALDVLGLRLVGTDLAVLSACQTGLGDDDESEGLLTLGRSFVMAGARSVITTLWDVNDTVTAELMGQFYLRLLGGAPRADALRAAKLAVAERHPGRPEYWAAFVLQGDTGPLLRYRDAGVPADQVVAGIAHEEAGVRYVDTEGRPVGYDAWSFGSKPADTLRIGWIGTPLRGPDWPAAQYAEADRLTDQAVVAFKASRIDEAHELLERALATLDGTPLRAPLLARVLDGLGLTSIGRGDVDGARELLLRALRVREVAEGESSRSVSNTLENLASLESGAGDTEAAAAYRARMDAIRARPAADDR